MGAALWSTLLVCAFQAGAGGGDGHDALLSMLVTWPPNGSVLPPSFIVKAEVLTPDHRAFIEANRHGRVCVSASGHESQPFCHDIFAAALHVTNLTTGRHLMKAWIEGPIAHEVVVASEAFEVEVSKKGPYYIPPPQDEGGGGEGQDDEEEVGGAMSALEAFSVEGYRDHRRRFCEGGRPSRKMMLLVGIKTSAGATLQRQSLRETWLQDFSEGCAWFIVGSPPPAPSPSVMLMEEEQAMYGDLLLGDTIPVLDSYYHLVDKTTAFFSWAVGEQDFHYLMVLDDDVFLQADQVAHSLRDTAPRTRFYAGQVWWEEYGRPLRPQRNPKHRNYLPASAYPMDELPPFAIGPHYILSHDLAAYIARNRDMLRGVGTLEDVSIGLWLLGLQVHPVHVPWFSNGRGAGGCQEGLVSFADLTPEGIRRAHRNLHTGRPLCQGYSPSLWVKPSTSLSGLEGYHSPQEGDGVLVGEQDGSHGAEPTMGLDLTGQVTRAAGLSIMILEPAMGLIVPGGQPVELVVRMEQQAPAPAATRVGLYVDGAQGAVAVWEAEGHGGEMRLDVEGLKEGSHVLCVARLPPEDMEGGHQEEEEEEAFVVIDVLPPPAPAPTASNSLAALPILTDLHLLPQDHVSSPAHDHRLVNVALLSINLDLNSQTNIFLTLAQHLPSDQFAVSVVTAQPAPDPSVLHQLTRALVPVHYVDLPPPASSQPLLALLQNATPATAKDMVPSPLNDTIAWLGLFDIVVAANTLDHPHTPLLLELARLAYRPVRVLELPNIHPPEGLPIEALTAPSRFTAQHPSTLAFRHHQHQQQPQVKPPPIAVIHPPALDSRLSLACPRGDLSRPFRVAFIARLAPDRSPGLLLHVAKQVLDQLGAQEEHRVEFVMIGGGAIEGQIRRMAGRLLGHARAAQRLRFVGPLERREVWCWYGQVDLLVNLKHEETFGIANAEAVAAGLPILAFDRGANRESIPSAHDHHLFPDDVNCTHAMANEIVRRLRQQPQASPARPIIPLPEAFKLRNFIGAYSNYFHHLLVTLPRPADASTLAPSLPFPPPPPRSDTAWCGCAAASLVVGHSPMASYLAPLLQSLFARAFPWTSVTVQAMPPPPITPHVFVSSVLDGGCSNGYEERCQAITQQYARQYRGALQVLWSGEAWEVVSKASSHHFHLVVTATKAVDMPSPHIPALYIPVLSTCLGEMDPGHQAAVADLERSLVEVGGGPLTGHGRPLTIAYMYSRCDRAPREALVAECEGRGMEVAYLGACQGAGRPEVPMQRWGRLSPRWHDEAIRAYQAGGHGFVVAFENSDTPGYVTEKILTAMLGGAIPIYWGPPDVGLIFNPRSFVDCSGLPGATDEGGLVEFVETCAALVEKVYRNDSLYQSMAREPRVTPSGRETLRHLLSWHPHFDTGDHGLPGQLRRLLWGQRQRPS